MGSIIKLVENLLAYIAVRLCRQIVLREKLFSYYEYPKIRLLHGDFRLNRDYSDQHIWGLSNESGVIRGVIVDIIKKVEQKIDRVLLPGEYNANINYFSKLFGIDVELYNLEEDPNELCNIAALHGRTVALLEQKLQCRDKPEMPYSPQVRTHES